MDFPSDQKPSYRTKLLSEPLEAETGFDESVSYGSLADREEQAIADRNSAELVNLVKSRLEMRLPGRIRRLDVHASENAVILAGQCSTYYTKQLAQHIAMAVLNYEQLVNNIDVFPAQ